MRIEEIKKIKQMQTDIQRLHWQVFTIVLSACFFREFSEYWVNKFKVIGEFYDC
jgi:hypothetical protein